MEPSAADVQAVAQSLGQPAPQQAPQPAPQAEPATPSYTPGISTPEPQAPQTPQAPQQQPTQPTQQPAPTQQPSSQPQDPFSTMFTQETPPQEQTPQTSQQPEPTPQPTQPVETQVTPPETQAEYQSFDDYMNGVLAGLPEAPEAPDPSKIDPSDEEGIKNFFDDLVNTAVQRATAETQKTAAIENSERRLWEDAMGKYPTLRDNKGLRDMAHNIRMGEFRKGIAVTPTQAADKLLDILKQQYQQGVSDTQVVTTIQDVQPVGGGGQQVVTTADRDNLYTSLQTGGEDVLANYLDSQIKAGNL